MPYNPQNIPSTPLPVSMMPAATEIQGSDLLLLVQTLQGVKRTRSMPISSLASSAPVQAVSDSKFFYSALPVSGAWALNLSSYTDKHNLEVFLDCGPGGSAAPVTCTITLPEDYTGMLVIYSRIPLGKPLNVVPVGTNPGDPIQMLNGESMAIGFNAGRQLGSPVRQYHSITSDRLDLQTIGNSFDLYSPDDSLPPIIASQAYESGHLLDISIGMRYYGVVHSGSPSSSTMVVSIVDNDTSSVLKSVSIPLDKTSSSGYVNCRILHRFTSSGFFELTASIEDSGTFLDYPNFSVMGTYAGTL